MASGRNLCVWLLGVVVRRYIDFLILLIPTPLVSVLFCSSIPTFCSFKKMFFLYIVENRLLSAYFTMMVILCHLSLLNVKETEINC